MSRARTFQPGAATLLAVAIASTACNAIFGITEGTPRAGDENGGDAGLGGNGASPSSGASGTPKGGKGGETAGGSAGLAVGGANHGGTSNGGGGAIGGDAGAAQAMGGSVQNGGKGGGASGTGGGGGETGGLGGSGGSAGLGAGMGGGAGSAPTTLLSQQAFLLWPRCSENTNALAYTCRFYGDDAGGSCPPGGAVQKETHPIGGTRGDTYVADIATWGAVTQRCYTGGTIVRPDSDGVVWQEGGEPTEAGTGPTFELHVKEEDGREVAVYYLNAVAYRLAHDPEPPACETETLMTEGDRVTIELPGAGTVDAIVRDPDCEMATNCISGTDVTECAPYGKSSSKADAPGPPFAAVYSSYAPKDERYGDNSAAWSQFVAVEIRVITTK